MAFRELTQSKNGSESETRLLVSVNLLQGFRVAGCTCRRNAGEQHGAVADASPVTTWRTRSSDHRGRTINSEQPVQVLVDGGVLHVRVQLGGLHPWRRVDLELVLPPDVHRVPDRQEDFVPRGRSFCRIGKAPLRKSDISSYLTAGRMTFSI